MGNHDEAFHYFVCFEVVLNLASLVVTAYYFLTFIKVSIVHVNMIRLIKMMMLYYAMSQISRLMGAFKEIIDDNLKVFTNSTVNYIIINSSHPFVYIDLLRVGSLISMLGCMTSLIHERIYATIKLKTYEKSSSVAFFVYMVITAQLGPAIGCTYVIFIELLLLPFCGATVLFVSIGAYLIFVFLEWYNKKQYQISLHKVKKYTLSERFQLQENIRTALLVKRFAKALFMLNVIVGVDLIVSNYLKQEVAKMVAYLLFNYSLSLYGFIFALVWVFNGWNLKRRCRPMTSKTAPHVYPPGDNPGRNRDHLRSFNGVKLIFTPDEAREIAFNQLNHSWN